VYGRIYQTIDEVRDAVRAFANRYNAEPDYALSSAALWRYIS